MTLLLATHHYQDRIGDFATRHPELRVLPKIVVNNKRSGCGEDLYSHDPKRIRRDIGMHYDAALACKDTVLLCLNDDVRFIAPHLSLEFLAAQLHELEVIFFQPNLASWVYEPDLDEQTGVGRTTLRQLGVHGRRVRFGRTHAFLCRRSWLLSAYENVQETRHPAQAFEKSTLIGSRFAFAQPMHLFVDSNTLPYTQNSLPPSEVNTLWLAPVQPASQHSVP